ncbi:MAG: hypothetical protein WDW38_006353 [Sanguina aurantia]
MEGSKRPLSNQSDEGPPKRQNMNFNDFVEDMPEEEEEDRVQPVLAEDIQLGEAGRNWVRPPVGDFSPTKDSLVFQNLEVDHYIASSLVKGMDLNPKQKQVPIVRIFGVNAKGNSVCVLVHGFEPYFYVEKPPSWGEEDISLFLVNLNKRLAEKTKGSGDAVLRIERENKASLWHYQGGQTKWFLKIVCGMPNVATAARSLLESGFSVDNTMHSFKTFESNVLFTLRFMVDTKIVGGNWLELPAGCYTLNTTHPSTFCQLEAHVRWDKIVSLSLEGEFSKLAPLRVLSIDIECAGRKGHFPEPDKDPVIQIASMVTVQGETAPAVKNVMTLGSCASIVGSEVMSFATRAVMKDTQFSSKAYGTHDYKDISIEGRIQFDLMIAIQRDHKLSSYSLNSVSAHFLGEQKEDVHHSMISILQNGDHETRRRLAVYCLKDAYLPQRLLDKLMFMYNFIEMARVTGVPMSYLLSKGQSIKVFSQLLRKSKSKGFLIPNIKSSGAPTDGVAYEGATVLEPKTGFYPQPVATLDFASLYPSIMMAHNLCYTTLLPAERAKDLPPDQVAQSPTGDWFVKSSVCKGIVPEILEDLLAARKRAKNDLKAEKDPFKRAVLDGRQMALKVSANSVYGFTGATIGKMPCLAISASTTAYGRNMIMTTREAVMAKFTIANGYEQDCDVIYGDTDSVMVNFKVPEVKRAMELGREAAAFVSQSFPHPVKLEFEKVYAPYLLMKKKRYAGLLWTRHEAFDKMDSKGIETVRRDNCLLVKNVVTTCLEKILMESDVIGAEVYVKGVISDLLMNRVDLSLLVISKGLTQEVDEYKSKAAHVELAEKMRKRDAATAPVVGDRVPYVIVKAAKGAKAYEKAEDPIYALEHNLPIDCQHYLEHHLSQPLLRIFEPVMKNAKDLLSGDHTRSISMSTPSNASGGIMKFAKVRLSCLACKAPLPAGATSLCHHCTPREADIYSRTVVGINELEAQYGALWTQCQRCQGSLHQDVLCTSRDCPIFYRRKKVQKDLNEMQQALARFGGDDW